MQVHLITLLVMISSCLGSSDSAKESVPDTAPTSSQDSLKSRVKRANYDMYRLARGLNMLRLGKRGGTSYYDTDNNNLGDSDQVFTLEDKYPQLKPSYAELQASLYPYDVSPEEYYNALASLASSYKPAGLRYRRSTPSDIGMVTPAPQSPEAIDAMDSNVESPDELKDGVDQYALYPEWAYGDADDVGVDAFDDKENAEMNGLVKGSSFSMYPVAKRQLPILRLGKRGGGALNMLRLGKKQDEDMNSAFTDENDEKRNLNMLRLGKRFGDDKRNLNMLRLGRSGNLNMLRLGKRQLNMLRLGKRQLNMLRLGKRQLNMLRLGKRQLSILRLGKRNLNMLRLGKRNLNMLRLGKREDDNETMDQEKRNLNMLRLGKRPALADKRNLNMLRLGKRSADTVSPQKET